MGTATSTSMKDHDLTPEGLAEMIGTLGCAYEDYKAAIISNGVDGKTLSSLASDESALIEALSDLGITKKLHQKVIMSKLPLLLSAGASNGPTAAPASTGNGHRGSVPPPAPALSLVQKQMTGIKLPEKLTVSPRTLMNRMFLIQGIVLDPADIKPAAAKLVSRLDRQSGCDGVNTFHCFISYRCGSDSNVAQKLYWMLKAEGFFPFLDKECLVSGMSWREGFLSGLQKSLLFVPLISSAALAPARNFTIDHSDDMVLLEHSMAFQVMDVSENPAFVCPIFVAHRDGNQLQNFSDFAPSLYADTIEPQVCKRCVEGTLIFPPGVGPKYAHNMAYMFCQNSYCKWNLSKDYLQQGPRPISDGWLRCPFDRVDATLVFPPGVGPGYAQNVAYFFCGNMYCKWNLVDDTLYKGARSIKDGWPGYPFDSVDATLVYPQGVGRPYSRNVAYMFCGDSYCKWDLTNDSLSQGPSKIKDGWTGYPFERVDAVIIYPPGVGQPYSHNVAYMFCGDSYCRWDLTTDTLSNGPRKIKDGWLGYPFA